MNEDEKEGEEELGHALPHSLSLSLSLRLILSLPLCSILLPFFPVFLSLSLLFHLCHSQYLNQHQKMKNKTKKYLN